MIKTSRYADHLVDLIDGHMPLDDDERATIRHYASEVIAVLVDLVERAKPIVTADSLMMADLTRHAPLPPEQQAEHDSTEFPSETWLADYEREVTK